LFVCPSFSLQPLTNGSARIEGGTRLGEHGFAHFGAEVQRQGIAVRNFGLNAGYLSYPAVRDSDGQLVKLGPNNSLPAGASPNPAEANRNSNPWRNTGVPQSTTASLSANLGYDVSNAVQLYGFGTYAHRNARSAQNSACPIPFSITTKACCPCIPTASRRMKRRAKTTFP